MLRRKKYLIYVVVLMCMGVILSACNQEGATGEIEVVKSFNALNMEFPEGIAIDKEGDIFVSLGLPGFAGGTSGEIWQISPDGTENVLVKFDVPPAAGLALNENGDLYFAHPTNADDGATGIYHLTSEGGTERLPGTEGMILPNGLAFDKNGDLYASDSIIGAVWRIPMDGTGDAEIWIQHELLEGCGDMPIGANGIAFWEDSLYAVNTTKGLLLRFPVQTDGSAGEPEIAAGTDDCEPDELSGMDGIALDVDGNVYALLVLQNKLVKIDPADGSSTVLLTGEEDGLFNPASIVFGTGESDQKTVYLTNFAVIEPGPEGNHGPAVLKYNVGTAGLPLP